ncbi:MAG TPA: cytochrome c oxidase subunit 3 [Albitalea sp.]|nr:cytochrome c oxidase subunit 3 [Albitalea sp.]
MSAVALPRDRREQPSTEATRLGMWVFIGTELLFFGGLLAAYLVARVHWPRGFALAGRHTDVLLGTVNTALLLTSSALVALAVACSEHAPRRRWTAPLLAATAALGIAFLAVKGLEYTHDWREQLFPVGGFALAGTPGAELFFMLYLLTTAVHAVHLLIGIGGIGALAWGSARERPWAAPRRIDAMALYWHFVDVVWIFLYPLLYLVERHA